MQTQHFPNAIPHTIIVGIHLQGVCVCVAHVCVCVCVDFNPFELVTWKLRKKFSDVWVKIKWKFGEKRELTLTVHSHECVNIHLRDS